ncbi:lytic transglycosylase domain-containing protein [Xenorhabdus stockiae]|uniref:lytic transglycosylase domain-containing protein n=1 Tax=Xenorhabdus stockiae TaxID=351614 RepID=UPI00406417B0
MIDALPPDNLMITVPVCMQQAAERFRIPLRVFIGIWKTEGGRVGMKNKNKNGTIDHGAFQINTTWAKDLEKYGITSVHLTNDFCISAYSSAYIVRYRINEAGGDFWDGVGRYHSKTPSLKKAYIQRVYKNSINF